MKMPAADRLGAAGIGVVTHDRNALRETRYEDIIESHSHCIAYAACAGIAGTDMLVCGG